MKKIIIIEFNGSEHRLLNLLSQIASNHDAVIRDMKDEFKVSPPRDGSWLQRHSPEIHIREWALRQRKYRGRNIGQRGRLPADIVEDYYTTFPDEWDG
jgi:hypothetical protein